MDDGLAIPGVSGANGSATAGCSMRALERLRAGELDAAEAEKLRAHAASCPSCGARLAELEREAADFKREVPFDRFADRVLAKSDRAAKRRGSQRLLGLAIAAGLATAVAAIPLTGVFRSKTHETDGTYVGIKGFDGLELFVGGTGAAPRMAKDGEALASGERVRVGYHARDHRFVLIFSVDEHGVATALYPESGPSLAVDKTPGTHLMGDSLELTGTGREKVIALFSDEPLQVSAALEAASREFTRAGNNLDQMKPLPLHATEESALTLKKPER